VSEATRWLPDSYIHGSSGKRHRSMAEQISHEVEIERYNLRPGLEPVGLTPDCISEEETLLKRCGGL
jgi:hypothetical protein